jgi:hypothetical protein
MILYTIVPEEFIFAALEEEDTETPQPEIEFKMDKLSLLGQPLANGRIRITRIISSNSQDYLNPKWQPGMIL